MLKKWNVKFENFTHEVEIEYKYFFGIKKVNLNGKNIEYLSYRDSNGLKNYKFSTGNHNCIIKEKAISIINAHELFINNKSIKTGLPIDPSKEEMKRYEWNRMKTKGKKKYLFSKILNDFIYLTYVGVLIVLIDYILTALWFDGKWSDIKNIKNIETNKVLTIYLLCLIYVLLISIISSLYTWNKYKKRYKNLTEAKD